MNSPDFKPGFPDFLPTQRQQKQALNTRTSPFKLIWETPWQISAAINVNSGASKLQWRLYLRIFDLKLIYLLINYYCNYKSSERRRRTAGESSCIPSPSPQSQTWQVMSAEHLSVCCSRGQICGHGTEMLPHVDDYYYCITCTHLVFKCFFCNNWNGIEEVRFLFFISVFLVQPTQCFLPSNSNLYMATVKSSKTQSLHVGPIANCCCLHGAKITVC